MGRISNERGEFNPDQNTKKVVELDWAYCAFQFSIQTRAGLDVFSTVDAVKAMFEYKNR